MKLISPLTFLFTLLLFTCFASAAEQLPDSAETEIDDSASMKDRFSNPAMNQQEMQNLYLQSPVELDNTEEEGIRSVNDQRRYSETDLQLREQLQGGTKPSPQIDLDTPPPLPSNPIRQL